MTTFTRRAALALVASGLVAGLASAPAWAQGFIERAPPELIVEVIPPVPHPGWHWVPGHWVWRSDRWVWNKGHYVNFEVVPMPAPIVEAPPPPPGPRFFWVRGHYTFAGRGWRWIPGHWHRG